ncbi:MAG: GNAT family N-acetyltransferase [Candidatus Eisenbacteria bacterium]|nr:GNAT family N-acetyltransferase [Candidatus Eisenbacteria bacterium]
MPFVIAPCRHDDLATLQALARHPSLADEFEPLQTDAGFEKIMGDPLMRPEHRWIASVDGMPAAFCFAYLAPTHDGAFAMIRLGVVERFRRQGIGEGLLACCTSSLEPFRASHGLAELNLSGWQPNPVAERFALRHGYAHTRSFWRMERAAGAIAPPRWPDGIVVRTFDGSERELAAFNETYNRSFADHYHYVRSTLDDTRAVIAQAHFAPEGLALAWRDGACVGFSRNVRHGPAGEVALVGVVPESRGMGLGRALLRWSVDWLMEQRVDPLFLMVDGENETALEIYRSEGFQVVRTRMHWNRPF